MAGAAMAPSASSPPTHTTSASSAAYRSASIGSLLCRYSGTRPIHALALLASGRVRARRARAEADPAVDIGIVVPRLPRDGSDDVHGPGGDRSRGGAVRGDSGGYG